MSAYPRDVTGQMVANFLAGGAAVNVLATHAGAEVRIVDAGVRGDRLDPRLHVVKPRGGTDNMTMGPAMSRGEAEALVASGIEFARDISAGGGVSIALGDMGIGNTTAAAAITSVCAGLPPRATTGRGTGIDDAAYAAQARGGRARDRGERAESRRRDRRARESRRLRDRVPRRRRARRGRIAHARRARRLPDDRRRAHRGRHRACRRRVHARVAPVGRTGPSRRARPSRACGRCSTWRCGSARDRAPRWR